MAVQLQDLTENRSSLGIHEKSYNNNIEKIKHSSKELAQEKIKKYESELKMSKSEPDSPPEPDVQF